MLLIYYKLFGKECQYIHETASKLNTMKSEKFSEFQEHLLSDDARSAGWQEYCIILGRSIKDFVTYIFIIKSYLWKMTLSSAVHPKLYFFKWQLTIFSERTNITIYI